MSEDKIEFAKDLVASNIRKTNEKINNSFDSNEDISEIKESNHTIRQIEKKRAVKAARRIQQTSMQAILSAEQDVLLRAAKRNAEQFALNLKAFSNDLLAEFKKIDPNCEVVLGIHTDPEGPELGVFIPFFEDEKPVENNLSAVRKRFNEIAYSDAVRNLIRKGVNNNG